MGAGVQVMGLRYTWRCVGVVGRLFVFFLQAEDGIRDAQESRGLGDVYKRQMMLSNGAEWFVIASNRSPGNTRFFDGTGTYDIDTVSYTHLTLPTISSV